MGAYVVCACVCIIAYEPVITILSHTISWWPGGCLLFLWFFCFAPQAPSAGPQGEQDGTGNWRGMLKKGDEAPSSRPGSPLRGAVNLLDVVTKHNSINMSHDERYFAGNITKNTVSPHSLCQLPGSCRHVSSGTVRSSNVSSSLTSSSFARISRTGRRARSSEAWGLVSINNTTSG